MDTDAGVGSEAEHKACPAPRVSIRLLTRTITRAQFAAPSSHAWGRFWSPLSQAATHHFANKGPNSKNYGFSSSRVLMWELDHKEAWVPKSWCFRIGVLEKTVESPLDTKGIKPVHPKGNQSWIFIGRTDAEAEAPIFWPSDVKSKLNGKDPDVGKDWGQEEKGRQRIR